MRVSLFFNASDQSEAILSAAGGNTRRAGALTVGWKHFACAQLQLRALQGEQEF